MAAELVVAATNEKLKEMDWTKNIEICELVLQDPGQAKGIVKAIKKRMGSKNSNTLLWAINLLEMLMNNCGEHIHRQVIDSGLLPILVKIVKKKSDLPVREKIFLLLDATQTSLGGASGRFPQYYAAYFELVSAGVKFSQAPRVLPIHITTSKPKVDRNNISKGKPVSPKRANVVQQPISQIVQEMRIIEKAGAALEVLRDVLDAIDSQDPEGAKDEFTLDLVEQCSFQKQCVMHLILTSRDENVVSKAIKLNDQLQNMLARHDTLLSVRDTSNATRFTHEEGEEEEDEMLFRRIRKGKACMKPDDENHLQRPVCLSGLTQAEMLHRPLIRPLCLEPKESDTPVLPVIPPSPALLPVIPPSPALLPVIPPPPAKHIERERFFKKRMDGSALQRNMSNRTIHSHNASSSFSDGSALERNMSNLTLHSRNASSSFSESVDSSD